MRANYEKLQSYFTGREKELEWFSNFVSTQKLDKHLAVIEGASGIGKSSLLHMFSLHCKNIEIPVALVSGEDERNVLEILKSWTSILQKNQAGIKFPSFEKAFELYLNVQRKRDDWKKKAVIEAGALAGTTAITSISPALGPIGNIIGRGVSGEFYDNLFSQDDSGLFQDSTKKFTEAFLEDIAIIAKKGRVVLMVDTFEKMTASADWIGEIVQKISPNVIIVIAGQRSSDWDRLGLDWQLSAEKKDLENLHPDEARKMINRRYASLHKGQQLKPEQVEKIVQFTDGVPMWIAMVLAVGSTEFNSVKIDGTEKFVRYLCDKIPKKMVLKLEEISVMRWFNKTILEKVSGMNDVNEVYDLIYHRLHLTQPYEKGTAMHDSIRDPLHKNLKLQSPDRYCELHNRMVVYFEKKQGKSEDDELEILYHQVCANEKKGIKNFQERAEELVKYRFMDRLMALINDVNTYPLEQAESVLWKKYYFAVLLSYKGQIHLTEVEQIYEEIIKEADKLPDLRDLRAKTRLRLIEILSRDERYVQPGNPLKIALMLQRCEELLPEDDWEQHLLRIRMATYDREVSFQDTIFKLNEVFKWCQDKKDYYGLALTCQWIKGHCAMHGRWRQFLDIENAVASIPIVKETPKLWVRTYTDWQLARVWMGRYAETEKILREVSEIQIKEGQQNELHRDTLDELHRDILDAVAFQGRDDKVISTYEKDCAIYRKEGEKGQYELHFVLMHFGIAYMCYGDLDNAKECLVESEKIFSKFGEDYMMHEERYFLGVCCLMRGEWKEAKVHFYKYLNFPFPDWFLYFKCGSLIGTARAMEGLEKKDDVPGFLKQAEILAQQYEYNDHLAAIRLMEGHRALEDGNQFIALNYYKRAMIYALRYNRFLLDDLVSGRPQGTAMSPIISSCLKYGDDGRKFLATLRDWWKTGTNNVDTPRPDTISLISEGITLLGAEKNAREIEIGDGSIQKSVVEQINAVLL